MWAALRIRIHTRSIHKPQRVGLGVAAEARIVVAVPVVVQATFELEPLAGEAGVQRLRAGRRMEGAPGGVDHIPDGGFCGVRHPHRAVQMVDVHHQRRR